MILILDNSITLILLKCSNPKLLKNYFTLIAGSSPAYSLDLFREILQLALNFKNRFVSNHHWMQALLILARLC